MKKIYRLGTRGSPLAIVQAQIVREKILALHKDRADEIEIEIVPLRTTGDWHPSQGERSFLEIGGNKGLFTKELEEALLAKTVDFAVHSMKDVSVWTPAGLCFAAVLERADPRDALLSPVAPQLKDLPPGARVGTSSLRRKAQILAARPDLKVVPLRGNVDTRLRKLTGGEAEATILAVAGLTRLGLLGRAASILEPDIMLPAVAQGILGIETRADDTAILDLIAPANVPDVMMCALAERAMLRVLDGSCRTPIAGMATLTGQGQIKIEALVAKPEGTDLLRRALEGPAAESEALGEELGRSIKADLPPDFFG